MTRINLVDPKLLHDKHLLAEYRELPRVFGLVEAAVRRGWTNPRDPRIPPHYVLGRGHVTFFYNKLGWLEHRFHSLVAECLARGWSPRYTAVPAVDVPAPWWGQWTPRPEDVQLNLARINQRLQEMSK